MAGPAHRGGAGVVAVARQPRRFAHGVVGVVITQRGALAGILPAREFMPGVEGRCQQAAEAVLPHRLVAVGRHESGGPGIRVALKTAQGARSRANSS